MEPDSASRVKTIGVGVLRWGLFLLVFWYVATQAETLWANSQDLDVSVDWKYLVAGGLVSQLSWLPSTWFWRQLIVLLGGNVETYPLIRAYYCGSLGKYIPGKAAVILIRSALLKGQQVSFVRASIASMVEAGAVMLVGCVVSLTFAMTIIPPDALPVQVSEILPRESTSWLGLFVVVAVLLAATPVIAAPANWIFSKISRIVEKRARQNKPAESTIETASDNTDDLQNNSVSGKLTWQFLASSSLMFALSWASHGVGLLLVMRSMNPDAMTVDNWIIATAAAAAATSIGFFAIFAPGGLMVREGLIITVLAPSTGGAFAVAAAGLHRIASLTAECLVALFLYLVKPRDGNQSSSAQENVTPPVTSDDDNI